MKKLLMLLVFCCCLFGSALAQAEVKNVETDNLLSTRGVILEIAEQSILVQGTGEVQKIRLIVAPGTHLLKGNKGQSVPLTALQVGERVTTFYSKAMTRSIPPQSRAVAIITNGEAELVEYVRVSKILRQPEQVQLFAEDLTIKVGVNANPYWAEIRVGDEVAVWYTPAAMTSPKEANASRAIVLNRQLPAMKLHLQAGVLAYQGKEYQLADTKEVFVSAGVTYVPLRSLGEALGYQVIWDHEAQAVELHKGIQSFMLSINDINYGKGKMRIMLAATPLLVNNKTFVPLTFITQVMGQTIEVLDTHI
ncbi:MAG: copper amine oxidase N-terminal domain-containing protein [Acidaminococcaceae bacterium]